MILIKLILIIFALNANTHNEDNVGKYFSSYHFSNIIYLNYAEEEISEDLTPLANETKNKNFVFITRKFFQIQGIYLINVSSCFLNRIHPSLIDVPPPSL
jgi:hypothetical protein